MYALSKFLRICYFGPFFHQFLPFWLFWLFLAIFGHFGVFWLFWLFFVIFFVILGYLGILVILVIFVYYWLFLKGERSTYLRQGDLFILSGTEYQGLLLVYWWFPVNTSCNLLSLRSLRDGFTKKNVALLLDFVQMRGGGEGPAQFFCYFFISAFLVNKRSVFPPKCQ